MAPFASGFAASSAERNEKTVVSAVVVRCAPTYTPYSGPSPRPGAPPAGAATPRRSRATDSSDHQPGEGSNVPGPVALEARSSSMAVVAWPGPEVSRYEVSGASTIAPS